MSQMSLDQFVAHLPENHKVRLELQNMRLAAKLANDEAKSLCEAIYNRHFRDEVPHFEMLDHTHGIISQIDNMVAGLM